MECISLFKFINLLRENKFVDKMKCCFQQFFAFVSVQDKFRGKKKDFVIFFANSTECVI